MNRTVQEFIVENIALIEDNDFREICSRAYRTLSSDDKIEELLSVLKQAGVVSIIYDSSAAERYDYGEGDLDDVFIIDWNSIDKPREEPKKPERKPSAQPRTRRIEEPVHNNTASTPKAIPQKEKQPVKKEEPNISKELKQKLDAFDRFEQKLQEFSKKHRSNKTSYGINLRMFTVPKRNDIKENTNELVWGFMRINSKDQDKAHKLGVAKYNNSEFITDFNAAEKTYAEIIKNIQQMWAYGDSKR